ncbi:signal peptidase I [Marininema halotolerans]|uniref:Signal peptidase I n=1 Tax=Marininema halotolerans TaxID=1155944 RepID=A0A1I6QHQ5_9BACL|nr:signal peptidase I [Marininema halotolerans]SFS52013.1 signal peptidase I [Marininema halotolerans]
MSEFVPRSVKHGRQQRGSDEAWEWLQALAIAVVFALIIRELVFSPFSVSGPSMMSTVHDHDKVIVNKLIYRIGDIKHDDVIVFEAPEKKDYIKRVIALPGEVVSAQNNVVRVNGKSIDEPYIDEGNRTEDFGPVKVPANHIFAMGDNRSNSKDSRVLGPISMDKVIGRADVIFWPTEHFAFLW